MSTIPWKTFDADEPDPAMEQAIRQMSHAILVANSVDCKDRDAVKAFADGQIRDYESGGNSDLNETLALHVFRPHEFDSDHSNDESLAVLLDWLPKQPLDWRCGSRTLELALSTLPAGGSKQVKGGRNYVQLDALVIVQDRRLAIEVETSNNLDNGFWTLRQALRSKMADYGVMIVPWTPNAPGLADEGRAVDRLDREFEGSFRSNDGPIYRFAIVRRLDVDRLMLK